METLGTVTTLTDAAVSKPGPRLRMLTLYAGPPVRTAWWRAPATPVNTHGLLHQVGMGPMATQSHRRPDGDGKIFEFFDI